MGTIYHFSPLLLYVHFCLCCYTMLEFFFSSALESASLPLSLFSSLIPSPLLPHFSVMFCSLCLFLVSLLFILAFALPLFRLYLPLWHTPHKHHLTSVPLSTIFTLSSPSFTTSLSLSLLPSILLGFPGRAEESRAEPSWCLTLPRLVGGILAAM